MRLSNAFGALPLRVGAAHVALSRSDRLSTRARAGGSRSAGRRPILVPAGAVVVSDAVDLDVPAARDLAVSVYLPDVTEPATFHEFNDADLVHHRRDSGNLVNAADLPARRRPRHRLLPDGRGSAAVRNRSARWWRLGIRSRRAAARRSNQNRTWPDLLSARLNTNPSRPRLAVVNQGIGCGRLLYDFCGPERRRALRS